MSVKDKASETIDAARGKAVAAYGSAREKAIDAYDKTRGGARKARERTGDGIDEAPLIALTGGLALGLIIGSLLPRSRKERELLRPVGDELSNRARAAVDAGRDAGKAGLDEAGLTPRKGEDVLRDIVKGAGKAARQAGDAAVKAARK